MELLGYYLDDYLRLIAHFLSIFAIIGGVIQLVIRISNISSLEYTSNREWGESDKRKGAIALSERYDIDPPEKILGGTIPRQWLSSLARQILGRKGKGGKHDLVRSMVNDDPDAERYLSSGSTVGGGALSLIWDKENERTTRRTRRSTQSNVFWIVWICVSLSCELILVRSELDAMGIYSWNPVLSGYLWMIFTGFICGVAVSILATLIFRR